MLIPHQKLHEKYKNDIRHEKRFQRVSQTGKEKHFLFPPNLNVSIFSKEAEEALDSKGKFLKFFMQTLDE